MSDRFPIFDVVLEQRRRTWIWSVRTTEGTLVMTGSRSSRSAARYEADRALFLMLLNAPYHSRLSARMIHANQQARARRSLPPKPLESFDLAGFCWIDQVWRADQTSSRQLLVSPLSSPTWPSLRVRGKATFVGRQLSNIHLCAEA